ncbi:MAG TPA: glycosyltransferase family 25 protein [Bacteroidales bacterium]|nr:glycosyltransferase family 25 protein [Bacteroidales bacterium]
MNFNKITQNILTFAKSLKTKLTIHQCIKVFGNKKDEIKSAYFINLDHELNRWKQFSKDAKRLKVKNNHMLLDFCYRVSAVNGKELNLDTVSSEIIKKSFPLSDHYEIDPDPKLLSLINKEDIYIDLSKEEIAVALSHIDLWQKIINEKIDYALILEDDIYFNKDFSETLNKAWKELPNNRSDGYKFDILYLSFLEVKGGMERKKYSKHLYKPIKGIWWLSGYVLSYAGAKKILNERPIQGPVDLWLNHMFNKLDAYMTNVSIINQRQDYESNNSWSVGKIYNKLPDK